MLRNLFQRYWQAKETARRGRGLGLFIAKGIVEAQGGAIWVESKPNQGTVFHFMLPPAAGPELPATERAAQAGARPAALA